MEYKDFLESTLRDAGALTLDYFQEGVGYEHKANMGDLVTRADHESSELIVSAISEAFPEHGIYSEELDEVIRPEAELRWLIDPLDGTRNFAHGIPMWCIMVALHRGDEAICSGIYAPVVNEMYFAEQNRGAFLNNTAIRAVERENFSYVLGIAVADPEGVEFERFHRALYELNKINGWIHNMGTNLTAAYLAAGKLDFYFNNCGMLHDHAPVALLCKEAGAIVTDVDGKPWQPGRKDLVIACDPLHEELMRLLRANRE